MTNHTIESKQEETNFCHKSLAAQQQKAYSGQPSLSSSSYFSLESLTSNTCRDKSSRISWKESYSLWKKDQLEGDTKWRLFGDFLELSALYEIEAMNGDFVLSREPWGRMCFYVFSLLASSLLGCHLSQSQPPIMRKKRHDYTGLPSHLISRTHLVNFSLFDVFIRLDLLARHLKPTFLWYSKFLALIFISNKLSFQKSEDSSLFIFIAYTS